MEWQFAYNYLKPKLKDNFILDLNPLSKANILLVSAISAFLIFDYYYAFILSFIFLLLAAAAKRFREFISLYWKIAFGFASLLFLVRAAFTNGTEVLFQCAGIHVTHEGIELGLISAALVMQFSAAFILFIKTTDMEDLVYMLEKHGLSHIYSYMLLSAFQTISDLNKSAKTIMDSQKCRGIETEGNIFRRITAFIPIMGPLVLGAITGAEEKSIAMDARAFSAPTKHTSLLILRKAPLKERLLVILFDIAFVLIIIWRISTWIP